MSMCKLYLGIDTSNYTTSIAVVDEFDNIVLNLKETLKVKDNNKGLRQQEAIFQHLNNLPVLFDKISNCINIDNIVTIASSSKPRNNYDSYMPVFVVGKNQAYILSKMLNKTYKEFSHQEGHIASALINNQIFTNEFLSLHISGGTTEVLVVKQLVENYEIKIVGGSLDISMGQLIDRIGVYLGLRFPCGNELDKLSKKGRLINIKIPFSFKDDFYFNLSGLENYFKKLIESMKYKNEDIIYTLFYTLGGIIQDILEKSKTVFGLEQCVITGGVSANSFIREYLVNNINYNTIFPKDVLLSTDNAVGTAYLGKLYKGHGV